MDKNEPEKKCEFFVAGFTFPMIPIDSKNYGISECEIRFVQTQVFQVPQTDLSRFLLDRNEVNNLPKSGFKLKLKAFYNDKFQNNFKDYSSLRIEAVLAHLQIFMEHPSLIVPFRTILVGVEHLSLDFSDLK